MSEPHRLVYDHAPSMGLSYLRALTAGGRKLPQGGTIKAIQATVWKVQPDAAQVAHYRRVCHIPQAACLPLAYPHVLAVPLQTAVVTSPGFPLPTLGLVHVSQTIEQLRHIEVDETLRLHVDVSGHRVARSGVEFDLLTRVEVGGQDVWRGVTTCLSRGDGSGGARERSAVGPMAGEDPGRLRSVLWQVPADMGRRYAAVAGDWNPIHLWPVTARMFGFKRAIVHGMWSLARVLAELDDLASAPQCHVQARFKRPVMLPARVLFTAAPGDEGAGFAVSSADGQRLHLDGHIGPLRP